MIWYFLLFILTIAVYILPFLPALQEWRLKRDAKPLGIDQSHEGDVRYFAKRFKAVIENECAALRERMPTLEPAERYCLIQGMNGTFQPSRDEAKRRVTQRIIISAGILNLPDGFTFAREIYGRKAIIGGRNNCFRAVLADGDIFVGTDSMVLRWMHGRTMEVAPRCRLMGRLSADREILLGTGCGFTRMHAPCVRFEAGMPMSDKEIECNKGSTAVEDTDSQERLDCDEAVNRGGRRVIEGNLVCPPFSVWVGDFVVHGEVVVRQGARIAGSVKAHGNMRIGEAVAVTGSLVCTKRLAIERGCSIGGPIIGEFQIEINDGVVVGERERPTTVTAPVIHVAGSVVVHGTVWARKQGFTLAAL